ncbi:MAG: hypothetical protein FJ386_09965 [Verrucomicrobia bacterium]|nr:hypothetical protein [Verrucomicrobiota bacterium]
MRDDQHRFLTLRVLPARVNAEQVAWLIACQPHDVPVLVAGKLLKPLGNPPQNGIKFFATREVLELAQDQKWLHRATVAIYQHWHQRNARRKDTPEEETPLPAT